MDRNLIKHILFFFDSRATFAYGNNVFQEIKKEKKIKCTTLISGNYLDKKLGVGLNIFKKNKIKITKTAKFLSSNNRKESWAKNLGLAIAEYSISGTLHQRVFPIKYPNTPPAMDETLHKKAK